MRNADEILWHVDVAMRAVMVRLAARDMEGARAIWREEGRPLWRAEIDTSWPAGVEDVDLRGWRSLDEALAEDRRLDALTICERMMRPAHGSSDVLRDRWARAPKHVRTVGGGTTP